MDNALFGEVRGILNEPPCEEVFERLLMTLGSGDVDDVLLEYVQSILDRSLWSSVGKSIPDVWVELLWDGQTIGPAASLCDDLYVDGYMNNVDNLSHFLSQTWMPSIKSIGFHTCCFDDVEQFAEFASSEVLSNLRELSFSCCELHDTHIDLLAQSNTLKQLQSFELYSNYIPLGESVKHLARHLDQLTCFGMNESELGDVCARILTEHPQLLQGKTTLELDRCDLSSEGVTLLAMSPHVQQLESLSLMGNDIGSEGLRALAESPYLSQLKYIDFSDNAIGDEGAHALANATFIHNLTSLNFRSTRLGDRGLERLVRSSNLEHMQILSFESCRISAEGMAAFSQCSWPALHTLNLRATNVGDQAIEHLASMELPKLRVLRLPDTRGYTDKQSQIGFERLIQASWLPLLTHLSLSGSVADVSIVALLKSMTLSDVVDLNLPRSIGDEVGSFLLHATEMNALKSLHLGCNDFSASIRSALKTAPHLQHVDVTL